MVGELSASHTSASSVRKAPASLLPPAVSMASAGCGSHMCRAGQQEGMLGVCEGCCCCKLASPDWQPCPAACMQNMVPKNSHRPEGGKAAGRAQPGVRDQVSMMPTPATSSDLGYRNRKEPSSSSSYIPLPRVTELESTEGLSINTDQRGVTSSAPGDWPCSQVEIGTTGVYITELPWG